MSASPAPEVRLGSHDSDLERRIERFAAAARRVRRRADGEAIHDLRVAIRRLEAALDRWRTELRPRPRRRAARALRRLRRALGPTRSREAERALLEHHLESSPDTARRAADPVLRSLSRRIRSGRRKAAERVSRKRLARMLERLARMPDHELRATPATLAAARGRAETLRRRAIQRIAAALEVTDDPHLHEARIATRRWRYAGEGIAASGLRGAPLLIDAQHAAGEALEIGALQSHLSRAVDRALQKGDVAAAARLGSLIDRLSRRRGECLEAWTAVARRITRGAWPESPEVGLPAGS
jgi:CHAD domain-containing protein